MVPPFHYSIFFAMKRCFLLSIFLHGAMLCLLFSWEVPLNYRFFPRYILEVSLVERIEGEKSENAGLSVSKPPWREKIQRDDVRATLGSSTFYPEAQTRRELGEVRIAGAKEDLKVAAPKAEEAEPLQKEIGEERAKMEEKRTAEPQILKTVIEDFPVLMARLTPPAGGTAEMRESPTPLKASLPSGGARDGSTVFIPSGRPETGPKGTAIGDGGKGSRPGSGEGGTSHFRRTRQISGDGDSVIAEILRRIEKAKRYPRMARKMGIEGRATIRFKLKPSGKVESAEVLESSGSDILDEASLETVHRAAPLPYKEGWLKVVIVFKIL